MVINKKSLFMFLSLACLMLMLGACSSNNSSEDTSSAKTVTDAVGEMEFPANPEKVLAPNMEDYLLEDDLAYIEHFFFEHQEEIYHHYSYRQWGIRQYTIPALLTRLIHRFCPDLLYL